MRNCSPPRYRSCLELAAENNLESVAFCCISTGEFHFPNELAAEIAIETVKEFLKKQTSVKKVIFNVFKDWTRKSTPTAHSLSSSKGPARG